MDIKDLNKSQLILLAILLSFITSIATGITTVTLMQQAPVSFTAPINRVIRQTVEKIEQVEGKTVTQTIVVKEEDLVVDAIAKNQSAAFTVTREITDEEGKTIETNIGRGFVISDDGTLVVDGSTASDKGIYYVKNGSGKFKAEFIGGDWTSVTFLKMGAPVDDTSKNGFQVPTFGDINKMKTGQKVLVFGGNITSFMFDGNKDIKPVVTKSNTGSMVLNLDGEVLGVALSSDNSFIPINTIIETRKNIDAPKKP